MFKKKYLSLAIVALVLGSCTQNKLETKAANSTSAATTVAGSSNTMNSGSAAQQFGLVNIQQVILNVEEGKTARKKLEEDIKKQQAEMAKEKKSLENMDRDFKEKMALLSDAAKQKKFVAFQKRLQDLQKKEMEFASSIKQREQQATQKIAAKVSVLVNKVAEEKNLSAVFEATSSGLMYVQDPVDLTAEIIEVYPSFQVSQLDDQAANSSEDGDAAKVEKK